jgi:hypothetical protein
LEPEGKERKGKKGSCVPTFSINHEQVWKAETLWAKDNNSGNICDYCGINIDIPWKDILRFFHEDCWKQYRRDGKIYAMSNY